ncbi:MAG: 6,7-dimethyl-8-ribityllumazine synthase [Planctomycetota bacterium]
MARMLEGTQAGAGLRIGVVAARFNAVVCQRLLESALATLAARGVRSEDTFVARVPGAFEVPIAARRLVQRLRLDAVIGLGAVVRGETPHFDFVCRAVTDGLRRLAADTGIPALFGVLTTDTMAQALARSGGDAGDKGRDVAVAAIEMATLMNAIDET